MAINPKIKRKWVKDEKRIVYLSYIKGFLKDFKVDDLYWAEYKWVNKKKYKTGKYKFPVYMPEVHYCSVDYWGEADEHNIVSCVLEILYWGNIDTIDWDESSGEFPKSKFKPKSRKDIIKYLDSLPTVIGDKKINKVLKNKKIDE